MSTLLSKLVGGFAAIVGICMVMTHNEGKPWLTAVAYFLFFAGAWLCRPRRL